MRHIVAFNGLVGGIPIAHQRKVVTDELAASYLSADLEAVLTLLKQELPPRGGELDAPGQPRFAKIRPDLIGEAAIIEIFTGPSWSEIEAGEVMRRAYRVSLDEAASVLVRLVQDFGYPLEDESATGEEKSTARRVMDWLVTLMREVDDPEHMLPLVSALPAETTILGEPAAELTERLVNLFREEAKRTDVIEAWIRFARLAASLAQRLSDLGRREEALSAAQEAIRHQRFLAAWQPDAFTPDLAMSLDILATALSALGRREEALSAAEEAIRHQRILAAVQPDAFTPDLATSLSNLAVMLSALGRREEALTAAEEAIRHQRILAAAWPEAFTPDLAMSLIVLANRLSALGRREEALTAAEDAVRHYRALAAARPDVFTPDLVRSLWVLGDFYGDVGKLDLAIATLAEGINLLSPVFRAVPAVVAGVMRGIVQSYRTQCEAARREPDAEMLELVNAEFERLDPTEKEK